jgi:hypothetical protein
MDIVIIVLFETSMLFAHTCSGGWAHSPTDGYANLECKPVATQLYSQTVKPGIEDITVNGASFKNCTLREAYGTGYETVLYYDCPDP